MARYHPSRPQGIKMCNTCGKELPATSDYYDLDSSKDDGLRTICKMCRKEHEVRADNARIDRHVKMMDEAALTMIENMARGGSDVPHIAEVYQCIMQAFDGAGGFAAHFMNQYLSAKPGSTTRTKMLSELVRISLKVSESGAAQIPIELMTDQDLQHKLDQQTKKMLRIHGDVDGTVEKAS